MNWVSWVSSATHLAGTEISAAALHSVVKWTLRPHQPSDHHKNPPLLPGTCQCRSNPQPSVTVLQSEVDGEINFTGRGCQWRVCSSVRSRHTCSDNNVVISLCVLWFEDFFGVDLTLLALCLSSTGAGKMFFKQQIFFLFSPFSEIRTFCGQIVF